jgi:DNA-binding NarL/FixJ family response regulator
VALRVVLAEDSYLVREGIRRMLDAQPSVELVGVADTYDSLLTTVDSVEPDVVVTDIRMPPTETDEGIRAAAVLRGTHPHAGVVVLSQYLEPAWAIALLEHGAAGRAYLLKERVSHEDQLVRAIEEVARGGSAIDSRVIEALVEARMARKRSRLAELTPREMEVLSAMAEGKSNSGVGAAVSLSERAVEKHINSIFTKLDLIDARDVNRRVKAVLVFLADPAQP